MMRKLEGTISAAILGAGLVLGTTPLAVSAADKPGHAEREFITKAASGGRMEVELGRYATTHAASDRVKQFGQRMVDDHTKANDELKQVADRQSVPLPSDMDRKDRETYTRLTKLNGAEFDRAYMKAMVEDHEADVRLFRDESRSAKDSDVKQFAAKTLPTLEDHLQMAKDIAAQPERRAAASH